MKLSKVYCHKCKKFLVEAKEGTSVYCPTCEHWIEVEKKKARGEE